MTYAELQDLLPDAAIEEVGERSELVIYTGLSVPAHSLDEDWSDIELVPMDDEL